MIEIDENEYAELKRVQEAAKLIGADPKRRAQLQELLAEAAPDKVGDIPLIRREMREVVSGIESKFDAFTAELRKEKEDRDTETAKRRMERQWGDGRRMAREAGYTDEGLDALESFMEKEGVASHKIAMAAYERENPPPEPVSSGGSRWDFFGAPKDGADASLELLMSGNDEGFLQQAVPAALKDARGR